MKHLLFLVIVSSTLMACNRKHDYEKIFKDANLYSYTVHELNDVVMGNNFSPIVASRNYTYANIAAYEVIAAGYPAKYNSLAGQLKDLKDVAKPPKGNPINYEFAALLAFSELGESVTFPKGSMNRYIDSIKQLARDHGMPEDMYRNSEDYAHAVSGSITAWAKKDMYLQTRSMPRYSIDMSDPGRWVPTPPAYAIAMEPNWNMIRCLVMDSCTQFMPPPPYKFNMADKNSDYYKQVMLIKNAVDSLTPEQKHIADFWDDNPFKLNVSGHVMSSTKKFSPPGHWQSIVGIAAKKAGADFPETVYAYAKTSIALFDAFIECWEAKYRYKTARPETVINKYVDADWR
ncbi:MAG: phosphoesterase PA-phosphatase, partial [Candidatus Dadabacteria bacterium]